METLEDRVRAAVRRGSAVEIQVNPLDLIGQEGSSAATTVSSPAIQVVGSAQPIDHPSFNDLLKKLKTESDVSNNQGILDILDTEKLPFLFTSAQLLQLISLTPSVKTNVAIVLMIAPRLVDPRSLFDEILGHFRYAEYKSQVEDALKARIQSLNSSQFKKDSAASPLFAGRGGRGGRGLSSSGKSMYMGSGRARPSSLPYALNPHDFDKLTLEDCRNGNNSDTSGTTTTTTIMGKEEESSSTSTST
eukprot:gene3023-3302_t